MNTVTDREWGLGHEDPALFDPPDRRRRPSGSRRWRPPACAGVVSTAKHHDTASACGPAPTPATPSRRAPGAVAAATSWRRSRRLAPQPVWLRRLPLPWDRTDRAYGSGRDYDDYVVAQLTELLNGYGDVFCVWLDGATARDPTAAGSCTTGTATCASSVRCNRRRFVSVCGPGRRWCGERGRPQPARRVERRAARTAGRRGHGQPFPAGRRRGVLPPRALRRGGPRQPHRADRVRRRVRLVPAEVNTPCDRAGSTTPPRTTGVRPAAELFDLWRAAVGGNSLLLLNVPPAASGRIAAPDVAALAASATSCAGTSEPTGPRRRRHGRARPGRRRRRARRRADSLVPDGDRPRLDVRFPRRSRCGSV